jgi:carboxypeptidase D
VNGKQQGTFKTEQNLSFLRVFEAGHEVMYYREYSCKCFKGGGTNVTAEPELSLQVFIQTMKKGIIEST